MTVKSTIPHSTIIHYKSFIVYWVAYYIVLNGTIRIDGIIIFYNKDFNRASRSGLNQTGNITSHLSGLNQLAIEGIF